MQQFDSDMSFQEGDSATDRCRRSPEQPPRSREAPFVESGDEHLPPIDPVHRSIILIIADIGRVFAMRRLFAPPATAIRWTEAAQSGASPRLIVEVRNE